MIYSDCYPTRTHFNHDVLRDLELLLCKRIKEFQEGSTCLGFKDEDLELVSIASDQKITFNYENPMSTVKFEFHHYASKLKNCF